MHIPQAPEIQPATMPFEQIQAATAALALSSQALHERVDDLSTFLAGGLPLAAPTALADGTIDQCAAGIDAECSETQSALQQVQAKLAALSSQVSMFTQAGGELADAWATEQSGLAAACQQFDDASGAAVQALSRQLEEFADHASSVQEQFGEVEQAAQEAFAAITTELVEPWTQALSLDLESLLHDVGETHVTATAQHFDAARQGFEQVRYALEASLGEQSGQFEATIRAELGAFGAHLTAEMQSRLGEAVQGLLEAAVQRMARDIAESIVVSGLGAQTSATLAPLVPQLVAIKHVADALREAIRFFRSFGFQ